MNSTPANQGALDDSGWPAGSPSFKVHMNSQLDRGFRELALGGVATRRIPGRSVGDPMNSIPAASSAAFTSINVDERLGGTSSTASKRLIVLDVTPALFASCSVVQRRAFRAERICMPVII
jgi:hypothetical protein